MLHLSDLTVWDISVLHVVPHDLLLHLLLKTCLAYFKINSNILDEMSLAGTQGPKFLWD